MKKATSKALSRSQKAELKALSRLRDQDIDTKSIPEAVVWSDAKRGAFYRPLKQQLTLRIDADVVAWFKSNPKGGKGYQTSINHALREYVEERQKKPTGRPRRAAARA